MIDWLTDHFDYADHESFNDMGENYIQSVIENKGQECGNCGVWRILKLDFEFTYSIGDMPTALRIIEECSNCGDEAFDIYEIVDGCP